MSHQDNEKNKRLRETIESLPAMTRDTAERARELAVKWLGPEPCFPPMASGASWHQPLTSSTFIIKPYAELLSDLVKLIEPVLTKIQAEARLDPKQAKLAILALQHYKTACSKSGSAFQDSIDSAIAALAQALQPEEKEGNVSLERCDAWLGPYQCELGREHTGSHKFDSQQTRREFVVLHRCTHGAIIKLLEPLETDEEPQFIVTKRNKTAAARDE